MVESGGVRLHVGGLGESVGKEDLLKIFSPMGSVDSVEFVRTKGRSFAYIDFSPSSQNSLTKLFSTYNGCVWKGGRLRLEKAKEHYLARLKKEWEQESSSKSDDTVVQAPDDSIPPPTHLNMFVPKLRKVKALPISGTGKHKYSFQRVAVSSLLPKNFCDCEEHSTSLTPHENHVRDMEALNAGINEEEVNIMNSVMSRLFEKNNVSKSEEVPEKDNVPEQESEIEEDQDNNLIINVVSKGKDMMKDLINSELDILSRKRKSALNETTTNGEGSSEGRKEKQIRPSKKRQTEGSERKESPKAKHEKKKPSKVDSDESSDEPTRTVDVKGSNDTVAWSQKSSWKALMANGNSGSFSVTSVLPDDGSSEAVPPVLSYVDFEWPTVKTKNKKKKSKRLTSAVVAGELPGADEKEKHDTAVTGAIGSSHSEDAVTDISVEAEPLEPVSSQEGDSENDHMTVEEDGSVEEDFNAEEESLVSKDNVDQDDADKQEPGKEPLEACTKSSGGSSWAQRATWTQLVSENNSSFSLTQLFPDSNSDKCEAPRVINDGDGLFSNSNQSESGMKQGDNTSTDGFIAAGVHVDSTPVRSLEENRQSLKGKNVSAGSRSGVKKPIIRRNIGSEETCTFMRSDTSLMEWKKAKQALSDSRRRKNNEGRVRS